MTDQTPEYLPAPSCAGCAGCGGPDCAERAEAPDNPRRPVCPSDCDPDCDVDCHEHHAVPWKRHHDPDTCPGTPASATVTVVVHAATSDDSRSRADAIADLVTAEYGQETKLDVRVTGAAGADEDGLRDRIVAALRTAAHHCDGSCGQTEADCGDVTPIKVSAWTHGVVSDIDGTVDAIATTAADAVQPELDRLAARAEAAEAALARVREVARRLTAHAAGFQDVLDETDRDPWAKTVRADLDDLNTALTPPADQPDEDGR